jgi:TPR repeat protein
LPSVLVDEFLGDGRFIQGTQTMVSAPTSSAISSAALSALLALVAFPSLAQATPGQGPTGKPTPDELLLAGRYLEIPPGSDAHGKALWAFAQFHLAPSGKVYDAAWEAHQKGEVLGTFIAWQCQKEGVGARRDEKLMWKLHFDLRTRLEMKKDPTRLESYILAQLDPADAEGVLKVPENTTYKEFESKNKKLKRERLEQAASAGCGQACDQLAKEFQDAEDYKQAFLWYDKACELGHPGGMRSKGFLLMEGLGAAKDVPAAFALGVRAAEAGDAFAMINVAVYYDRGLGTEKDQKKAQAWLDKAAASGHWAGRLERGMAHFKGMYGLAIDPKAGEEDWRQGHALRHRAMLDYLARFYAQGIGVAEDGKRAAHFAEAAFVQGSSRAARVLAYLHGEGVGGLDKNEKLKDYWSIQADPNLAFTLGEGLAKMYPELTDRLKQIDPWAWGK